MNRIQDIIIFGCNCRCSSIACSGGPGILRSASKWMTLRRPSPRTASPASGSISFPQPDTDFPWSATVPVLLQRCGFSKIRNPCCALYKKFQQSGDFLSANWIYLQPASIFSGPNYFTLFPAYHVNEKTQESIKKCTYESAFFILGRKIRSFYFLALDILPVLNVNWLNHWS